MDRERHGLNDKRDEEGEGERESVCARGSKVGRINHWRGREEEGKSERREKGI